jgi:hypothetical protein
VLTAADFRATVQEFIERQAGDSLPAHGEVMMLGHADAGWKRFRIKPPYTRVAGSMVRGFILKWKVDRLAIVVPGESPRQFRVAFAERGAPAGLGDITDRRLAGLVASAHKQWSQEAPRPLRRVLGRPWPVPLLSALLLVEVGPFVIRVMRHGLLANPVSDAYYALVVVTAVVFLIQVRFSTALALLLAAVQVVRTAVLFIPLVQANGFGVEAFWLAGYLSEPAAILVFLWLLYARRDR